MSEDLPELSGGARDLLRRWHVAGRAFVLDGLRDKWVIERLPADGSVEVRITGRIGHDGAAPARADRDVFPAWRDKLVVARHTLARMGEHRCIKRRRRRR
jgi:hypothetical protein